MSTQENVGDAPADIVVDVVDTLPVFRHNLQCTSWEEAMKVRKENIDITSSSYSMTHPNRGIALIIDNEDFPPETNMPVCRGYDHDAVKLKNVLTNKFQFNVVTRKNMTVGQMKKTFQDISKDDHTKRDCFLCVILSHGIDGDMIYGTDGTVALHDIISYILPNKCPSLGGKPKLFFVQANRGTKLDKGVEVKDGNCVGRSSSLADASVQKIPLWGDILISYSSAPGYISVIDPDNGSWFIQSLCDMLERYGNDLEILQIMIKVNSRVANEYEFKKTDAASSQMKQIPYFASMLTKELKFSPKTNSE